MRVITISAAAQHGKDTIAKALKEIFDNHGVPCKILHYATYLKALLVEMYGWTGQKDTEGRSLLQYVGTEIFRKNYESTWTDMMISTIRGLGDTVKVLLIPDVRFPNEIIALRDSMYVDGVFSIKVERDGFDNGLTEEQKNHPSETALNNWRFDLIVKNDKDLQSFLDKAEEIVRLYEFSQKKETPVI